MEKVGQLGLYDRLSQGIRIHLFVKCWLIKTDTVTIVWTKYTIALVNA